MNFEDFLTERQKMLLRPITSKDIQRDKALVKVLKNKNNIITVLSEKNDENEKALDAQKERNKKLTEE